MNHTISLIDRAAIKDPRLSRNVTGEESISAAIIAEYPWSPFVLKKDKPYLVTENFLKTNLLVFDIDNDREEQMSLAQALERFARYQHIIGTSRNHGIVKHLSSGKQKPACDRYRVILFFAEEIHTAESYKANYAKYTNMLGLSKIADPIGDLARFYYPCKEIISENLDGEMLETVSVYDEAPQKPNYVSGIDEALHNLKAKDGDENWHKLMTDVLYEARKIGKDAEWVKEQVIIHSPWGKLDKADVKKIEGFYKKTDEQLRIKPVDAKLAKLKAEAEKRRKLLGLIKEYCGEVVAYQDSRGFRALLGTEGNIARPVSMDSLASRLAHPLEANGFLLMDKTLREYIRTYLNTVQVLREMPRSLSSDKNVLAFNHIDISTANEPCPTWDHFISGCGANGQALMAFVWAVLAEDVRLQQYIFLKGSGGDGKGSFVRWLNGLMGTAAAALTANDGHWQANCVGTRLGVFNDLNNTMIVMSSEFKQITGGDMVSITQKYEKAYSAVLDTCFILTTNKPLNATGDAAEKRRAIVIEFPKPSAKIANYENNLKQETAAFLHKCKAAFETLWSKEEHRISCDYEAFNDATESFEEELESIFDKNFVIDKNSNVSASDFQDLLRTAKRLDNRTISNFKEWLERVHGIRVRRSGSEQRRYAGIKLRDPILEALRLVGNR